MPRPQRSGTGTEAERVGEQVSAGRRSLAAIDPAVMRRVIGRPEDRAASDADDASTGARPAGRYSRARAEARAVPPVPPVPSPRREA